MGKHSEKVSKNKKKKIKINKAKIIRLLIILIIAILISIIFINSKTKQEESNDKMSLIIDNQDVTSQLEKEIVEQDGIAYISFNDVQKFLDKNIYQEETGFIITSSDKKVAALKIDSRDIEINGSKVEIKGQAFKNQDGTIFIPISELENVYDIDFNYIKETKKITIDYYSKSLEKAYVTKNISVKSKTNTFSETISKVKKGNWIIFISDKEDGKWAKVRTQDGNIGYIKKKYLTNFVTERENIEDTESHINNDYLEKDITKEKIANYEDRKNLIDKILQETVLAGKRTVKIIYEKEKTSEEFERFKIEIVPILKECGISVIF